jgi:hypothetical protein
MMTDSIQTNDVEVAWALVSLELTKIAPRAAMNYKRSDLIEAYKEIYAAVRSAARPE